MPEVVLARASELAVRAGRSATDPLLLAALVDASRRFRSAVHHPVHLVSDDTIELDGPGSRILLLPAAPVVSISSFTFDGVPQIPRVDYRLSKKAGMVQRISAGTWPSLFGAVEITYTHGYVVPTDQNGSLEAVDGNLPGDIQAAVLDMAETLLNVVKGLQSRTVLGDTMSFGTVAVTGVTQQWSDAVDNHVLHRSA